MKRFFAADKIPSVYFLFNGVPGVSEISKSAASAIAGEPALVLSKTRKEERR